MRMRAVSGSASSQAASAPSAATVIGAGIQRANAAKRWRSRNISARLARPMASTRGCACESCSGSRDTASSTDLEGIAGAPASIGSWRRMIMMPIAASMASTTVVGNIAAYWPARSRLSSSCSAPVSTIATSTSG